MNHLWSACLLGTLVPLSVFGADDSKPSLEAPDTKTVSPLRKLMDKSVDWTELFVNDRAAMPMTSQIVLRWSNNTRGSENGMTVLYLAGGRPEAVCCVYPWEMTLAHEFDSLSRSTLVARRDGVVVWTPQQPGVKFRPIPRAEIPADSPAARLRQMKELARQFSSTMLGWVPNSSDREALRLLPQPLYRYESKRNDLLDGAVFAFVQGTDPESLLLLEAFKAGDGFEWQFAFARRTSGELEGRHEATIVWHADRFPPNNDPRSIHLALTRPIEPGVLDATLQTK